MTNCPTRTELQSFLNEELDAAHMERTARHLDDCCVCQSACDDLLATMVDATGANSTVNVDQQLRQLMDQLQDQPAPLGHIPEVPLILPGNRDAQAPLGRIRQYALLERIAAGSQGVLFRARDESLDCQVAIKMMHPRLVASADSRSRLLREARLGAALQHPHVVRVLQVIEEPELPPCLVMEYVDGESLRELLDRVRCLPPEDAARFVAQVAQGLQAAHAAGMVHRDVKTSNVLIDRSGSIRITDFGLAIDETATTRMTQEGAVIGTPSYMSPEQVTAPQHVDLRSDLYSLGVIFYELLTGEVPFRGSVRMTLLQIVHDDPRPLRQLNDQIPRDLETICLRLLAKHPNGRFQSATELIDEIERWRTGRPILSRPITHWERSWRWCRRNPIIALLTCLTVALLLLVVTVSTWSTWHLAEARRRAESQAALATDQRNAALDTLSQLVFQLQGHFDRDEIDLSELQKQTLQIALDGLHKIQQPGNLGAQPDLPLAEAMRRMSEVLQELEQAPQATRYLGEAETILRKCLQRNPDDTQAIRAMVETLWAQDDLEDEDHEDISPEDVIERLSEATELARHRLTLESVPGARRMLASSLIRESHGRRKSGDLDNAATIANEAITVCDPLLQSTTPPDTEGRILWYKAVNARYLALKKAKSHHEAHQWLTERWRDAETTLRDGDDDFERQLFHLSLLDWLMAEHQSRDAVELPAQQEQFANLVQHISQRTKHDTVDTAMAVDTISTFVDDRQQLDEVAGMMRLQNAAIRILEHRLAVDADDDLAQADLARTWYELAMSQDSDDQDLDSVWRSLEHSLRIYRQMQNASLDLEDQLTFVDALLEAAEISQELERSDWRSLAQEARDRFAQHRSALSTGEMREWLTETERRLAELLSDDSPQRESAE